jgi:hypothetical protein
MFTLARKNDAAAAPFKATAISPPLSTLIAARCGETKQRTNRVSI